MGGFGVVETAAAHPLLFAAIVPIAGGENAPNIRLLQNVPTWAFRGADDKTVPIAESEQMVEAIQSAGGQPKFSSN
jgi:predicted peptidase